MLKKWVKADMLSVKKENGGMRSGWRTCLKDRTRKHSPCIHFLWTLFLDALLYLVHISVDYCHRSNVNDVADRAFEVGEMDWLVQTHLDRANDFGVRVKSLEELVAAVRA